MRLSNRFLTIEIDDATGRLSGFAKGNKQFLIPGDRLFELRLRRPSGEAMDVDSNHFAMHKISYFNDLKGMQRVTLEFSGCSLGDLRVNATVTVQEASPLSNWQFSLDNGTGWPLEWVDYPIVILPHDLVDVGGDMQLLWPGTEGALIGDATLREGSEYYPYKPMEFPGGGWTGIYPGTVGLQMMACYGPRGGLYFAAHDPKSHLKAIEYMCQDDALRLMIKTFCDGPTACWALPFPMVLGVFQGDWREAADIYRNWYEAEMPDKPARLADRSDLPPWLIQSPVVVGYPVRGQKDTGGMAINPEYFPFTNALPLLKAMADRLDSRVMTLLMHWEGTAPWAPPYVWPPLGGEAGFGEFVDGAHNQGTLVGLYCSGIGYTIKSAFREDYDKTEEFNRLQLADIMCLPPDNKLPMLAMGGIREGYEMCPTQPIVTDICCGEVAALSAAGVDYAQFFDQNLGGAAYACYAHNHGHPPVPGRYRNAACLALFQALNKAAQDKGHMVIGCEVAAAEPFIKELPFKELRSFTLYDIGQPVPLYQYVFHEYLGNFSGNQITAAKVLDCYKNPENLAMRLAYAFAAGELFMLLLRGKGKLHWGWLMDWDAPEIDEASLYAFVAAMNHWRKSLPEFLLFGRMESPLPITCGTMAFPRYRGMLSLVQPTIFTSAWRSPDGRWAQFLVNYTAIEQKLSVRGEASIRYSPMQASIPINGEIVLPAHSVAMLS